MITASTASTFPFDDATVVQRNADQITARIDGQVVAMSVVQGKYVGFNPVASAIWDHLATPLSVRELCLALARDFDGDPAVIREDLIALLGKLDGLELIATDHSGR